MVCRLEEHLHTDLQEGTVAAVEEEEDGEVTIVVMEIL
jgi:hypothetical protein